MKKKLEMKVYSYQDLQPISLNDVLGGGDDNTCCTINYGMCNINTCTCHDDYPASCNGGQNTTE